MSVTHKTIEEEIFIIISSEYTDGLADWRDYSETFVMADTPQQVLE